MEDYYTEPISSHLHNLKGNYELPDSLSRAIIIILNNIKKHLIKLKCRYYNIANSPLLSLAKRPTLSTNNEYSVFIIIGPYPYNY